MARRSAAAERRETSIVLGTATPGGGFPLYGDAFITTIRETGLLPG